MAVERQLKVIPVVVAVVVVLVHAAGRKSFAGAGSIAVEPVPPEPAEDVAVEGVVVRCFVWGTVQERSTDHNCRVKPDHRPPVVIPVFAQAENDKGSVPGKGTTAAVVAVVGFVAAAAGSAAVAVDVVCEAV